VKCFYIGVQHGVWLPLEALSSRASLAAAVSHAFRDDGVTCSSEAATVVFVAADKQTLEFAGGQQQQPVKEEPPQQHDRQVAEDGARAGEAGSGGDGGGSGGEKGRWEAAARSAVRVYVR
jgi:hypothetical protein